MALMRPAQVLPDSTESPYGSRLLPHVVDELAETDPERVYATYARSSNFLEGFRNVTMLELAQAVSKLAFWIDSSLGRSSDFETITYVGPQDIRYAIMLLACIKCGYKLLVPSPRNAPWMNISLLESTGCNKIFYALEMTHVVESLKKPMASLNVFPIESLGAMLHGSSKFYPYDAKFAEAKWDPILVLHSSGSTGPPKSVVTNHASWAVADSDRNMPTLKGRRNQNWAMFNFPGEGGLYYSAFQPFHLGGIMSMIVLPIYSTKATVVLGPIGEPPSGHLLSEIMKHHKLKAILAPPHMFKQLAEDPKGLEQASQLDFLLSAGGPMTETAGNALSQVTDVCQFYGATETNGIPTLVPRRSDWAHFEFHPSYGVELQPSDDEAFELVLLNGSHAREDRVFTCNFPDVKDYHTRDLFKPHPTKNNLWKFHGRKDDIIIFANGLMLNPVPSEAIIAGHPLLSAALIVGFQRPRPALLIEPSQDVELEVEMLIDEIWPAIERSNALVPDHGRVSRSMILVAGANKPFERAAKGTVIRKMTAEKFAPELGALYDRHSRKEVGLGTRRTHIATPSGIRNFLSTYSHSAPEFVALASVATATLLYFGRSRASRSSIS